jgi:Domain of unknown function (DUF397)/TIR domain
MKIFISWSGDTSRAVAETLRFWLPSVLQYVEPYMSTEDVGKGARWSEDLARRLEQTSFGIVCVTSDNVGSPWLNFEAGALSKSVESSRVSPFLFGLNPTDLVGPLAQFQASLPKPEDVARLIDSINALSDQPIDRARLDEAVQMWWPRLNERLQELSRQETVKVPKPQRDIRGMVEEILLISRGLQRRIVLDRVRWRRSSFSDTQHGVEVGFVDDAVAMRDAKDPEGPVLMFGREQWKEFLRSIRDDESESKEE